MKNSAKLRRNASASGSTRRSVIGVVTITVLLIGVATALSMQSRPAQKPVVKETLAPAVKPTPKKRKYVTADPSGEAVVVDRETGQTRDLTPEEAKRLADGIKQLVNRSTTGLVQVQLADGTVSMDLEGRFQDVMLAKREADGSVSQSCVNDLATAAAFFEIDPRLLGLKPTLNARPVSTKLEQR